MEAKQIAWQNAVTEKLYYEDSRMERFTAVVLGCEAGKDGYRVVLDRTAFFPEGGGQFGDIGWLNEVEVTDTKEKGGVIYHRTAAPLKVGTTVLGRLNFEERFSRMQQHTGEHILSGIVHSLYGYNNVGFHLGADVTTLDFDGELSAEDTAEIEHRANRAVFANLPVEVLYPTREELASMDYRSKIEIEGQVRLVSIPGVDLCACCAPHVSRTGEIGLIKILSCDRHRGGCRMTIVCGDRALADYQRKLRSVTEVSVALSAKPEQIGVAVAHLKEQQARMRAQLNWLQEVYLKGRLETVRPDDRLVCIFEEELDNVAVRNFVNAAMERCGGVCGAFVGTEKGGYRYILGSRTTDVRLLAKLLGEKFHGKGGGKPEMVQGSLLGGREAIERELKAVCG